MHDLSTAPKVLTFTSEAHPRSLPWAVVYGRALVRPIASCMLPVMILTLVAVLEGARILPGLLWASGAALLVASMWTSFRLQREVAEISVRSDVACIRTVWEVLNEPRAEWHQVLDVRDYGTWAHVTVGYASYELDRGRWNQYAELVVALKASSRAGRLIE